MIEVDIDKKAIERAAFLLSGIPEGMGKALYHSAVRAATAGRTTAKREAAKVYTVPASLVQKTIVINKGSKANPSAEIHARSSRLPLSAYKYNPQRDTTGAKRKPVRVSVRKGNAATVKNGFVYNKNIYTRVGATSLPVRRLFSLSVPQILENDNISEKISDTMQETFEKRLQHETLRLLEGYDAKPNWK